MARRNRDTTAILKTVSRSEQRSSLFWWLVEHHDEMIAAAKGKRILWRPFCAKVAALGLTDTKGQPPCERAARETWMQARKEVAASREAAAAQPPRPVYPSRVDKDWRPANAPPPGPATQAVVPVAWSPTPEQQMLPVRTTPPHEKKPYDPKENLARLKRVINERSGR
jgi:hypothetical protein